MSMREPRLLRNPNGGLLNVDVTLLQIGLSRCRCIAEDTIVKLERGETIDIVAVMNEILDESRKTIHGIEDNAIFDEVGTILQEKEDGTTQGK